MKLLCLYSNSIEIQEARYSTSHSHEQSKGLEKFKATTEDHDIPWSYTVSDMNWPHSLKFELKSGMAPIPPKNKQTNTLC